MSPPQGLAAARFRFPLAQGPIERAIERRQDPALEIVE
jgi:hypothetical protein